MGIRPLRGLCRGCCSAIRDLFHGPGLIDSWKLTQEAGSTRSRIFNKGTMRGTMRGRIMSAAIILALIPASIALHLVPAAFPRPSTMPSRSAVSPPRLGDAGLVRRGLWQRTSLRGGASAAAAETGGEAEDLSRGTRAAGIPNTWELVKFAIPTLGIWISSPILSLVDSAVVGRYCSAAELAALGPGMVVSDSSAYVFMFLAVATTNLYSTALSQGKKKRAASVVSQSLSLALACGLVLAVAISFGSPWFLSSFASKSSGAVVNGALAYSAIRAWGTPATLLTNVAQAACFGDKDAVTPLRAVWLAGALNLLGDLVLVPWLGMGIKGAAIATVAAQYAGLGYIMTSLISRQANLNPEGSLLELPSKDEFLEFFSFAGPAFFALLGKVVTFSSLTYAVAAAGTVSLAAHQVVMNVWFFFCKFGDAVSSTAQTYLPGAIAANDRKQVRAIVKRCLGMAVGLGVIDSLMAGLVPVFGAWIFTKDAAVAAEMASIAPHLCVSLIFHSSVMALEGILFASRQQKWLAWSYCFTTVFFTTLMHFARGWGIGLTGVWVALFSYQIFRFVQFGTGVIQGGLLRKGEEADQSKQAS